MNEEIEMQKPQESAESHLKPCPFCGNEEIEMCRYMQSDDEYLSIGCDGCEFFMGDEDEQGLMRRWNSRPANKLGKIQDSMRLSFLIEHSSLDDSDSDSEPVLLVVTQKAVPSCAGTWTPEYQEAVRAAIDKMIPI